MDTAAINYRVADFLNKYPPFQAMAEADVLGLAGRGRVRFHERGEHVLWQGESHKHHVLVIQQGVVSLWDEADGQFELRDVRGPGDLLGVERFNGAASCLHSARAATDVVLYALPAADFESLLGTYPAARKFVSAYGGVTADYQVVDERRHPQDLFLHDIVKSKRLVTCQAGDTIRHAARSMQRTGADAVAVTDSSVRVRAVVTARHLLDWIADGDGDPDQPLATILREPPIVVAPDASVADGVLAMSAADAGALAITGDATIDAPLHAIVTAADLGAVFGDQPAWLLRDIRRAADVRELRALNHRARAFVLQHLATARSVDWLATLAQLVDTAIVSRILAIAGDRKPEARCWCVCGPSGRGESLTRLAPEVVLIAGPGDSDAAAAHARVMEMVGECDYLDHTGARFDDGYYAASIDEWKARFLGWVRDPVRMEMYRARALFDLHPFDGDLSIMQDVGAALRGAVDRDFLRLVAHDCLSSVPPLTFFKDAVVDEWGEHSAVFRLAHSALQPLVDVARVFGMATGRMLGGSTRERLAMARRLLPAHESTFREAADTFAVVLWQQGRIGIAQGTNAFELPPALLGRHDRQVLKSGFRVILRLLELTASWEWLDAQ
jgi:CBS domain-containing protein